MTRVIAWSELRSCPCCMYVCTSECGRRALSYDVVPVEGKRGAVCHCGDLASWFLYPEVVRVGERYLVHPV